MFFLIQMQQVDMADIERELRLLGKTVSQDEASYKISLWVHGYWGGGDCMGQQGGGDFALVK